MKKPLVYALAGAALLIGLLIGYGGARLLGPQPGEVRNARLRVGDEAPDFRLMDHTGRYIRLSSFRGESNVVIAFYPLAWTPV